MPPFVYLGTMDVSAFTSAQHRGALAQVVGKPVDPRYQAIRYHRVKNGHHIISAADFQLLNPSVIYWAEAEKALGVHTDNGGVTTCLNIYLGTGDGITSFWTKDGEPNGSFKASHGDVYLLDVSSPHSVELIEGTRTFIKLAWVNTPFEAVLSRLQQSSLRRRIGLGSSKPAG